MDRKPLIGIVPLFDEERHSYWMIPGYMRGIEEAGGIPVMLPLTDDEETLERLVETCDGFLLTGGQDVDPRLYGEESVAKCGKSCPARDAMEKKLFSMILKRDMPVLGICRGIQFMSAALGGSLYQDIPSQRPSALIHCQKPPYHIPSHNVKILLDTPLYTLLKKENIAVNSYHHQGVKVLPACLRAMARAEDGLTEAIYMPGKKFVWAVQWHPELSFEQDEDNRKIFAAFVSACRL